ncbi:hypothetical protein SAMN05216344_1479 [Polaromonas sp. OV174]|nr:hypothetical protein SAMN05216344_1479 [Polaromonas sp. OV174]
MQVGMIDGWKGRWLQLSPGVVISAIAAVAAMFLAKHCGAPVMLLGLKITAAQVHAMGWLITGCSLS